MTDPLEPERTSYAITWVNVCCFTGSRYPKYVQLRSDGSVTYTEDIHNSTLFRDSKKALEYIELLDKPSHDLHSHWEITTLHGLQ